MQVTLLNILKGIKDRNLSSEKVDRYKTDRVSIRQRNLARKKKEQDSTVDYSSNKEIKLLSQLKNQRLKQKQDLNLVSFVSKIEEAVNYGTPLNKASLRHLSRFYKPQYKKYSNTDDRKATLNEILADMKKSLSETEKVQLLIIKHSNKPKSQNIINFKDEYGIDQNTLELVNWQMLRGLDTVRLNLSNMDLRRFGSMRKLNLSGANFQSSNLVGVNFSGSVLNEAVFDKQTNCQNTDFSNSSMKKAILGPRLNGAVFAGADLSFVNFASECVYNQIQSEQDYKHKEIRPEYDLRFANFQGAKTLEGADFSNLYLEGMNFEGLDLNYANFKCANLKGANMSEANLKDAELINSNCSKVIFAKSDLSHSCLEGANLQNANLQAVTAKWTNFRKAKVASTVLKDIDLTGADLSESDVDFRALNTAKCLIGTVIKNTTMLHNLVDTPIYKGNLSISGFIERGAIFDQEHQRVWQIKENFKKHLYKMYSTLKNKDINSLSAEEVKEFLEISTEFLKAKNSLKRTKVNIIEKKKKLQASIASGEVNDSTRREWRRLLELESICSIDKKHKAVWESINNKDIKNSIKNRQKIVNNENLLKINTSFGLLKKEINKIKGNYGDINIVYLLANTKQQKTFRVNDLTQFNGPEPSLVSQRIAYMETLISDLDLAIKQKKYLKASFNNIKDDKKLHNEAVKIFTMNKEGKALFDKLEIKKSEAIKTLEFLKTVEREQQKRTKTETTKVKSLIRKYKSLVLENEYGLLDINELASKIENPNFVNITQEIDELCKLGKEHKMLDNYFVKHIQEVKTKAEKCISTRADRQAEERIRKLGSAFISFCTKYKDVKDTSLAILLKKRQELRDILQEANLVRVNLDAKYINQVDLLANSVNQKYSSLQAKYNEQISSLASSYDDIDFIAKAYTELAPSLVNALAKSNFENDDSYTQKVLDNNTIAEMIKLITFKDGFDVKMQNHILSKEKTIDPNFIKAIQSDIEMELINLNNKKAGKTEPQGYALPANAFIKMRLLQRNRKDLTTLLLKRNTKVA